MFLLLQIYHPNRDQDCKEGIIYMTPLFKFRISSKQLEELGKSTRRQFEVELASWLRTERTAYVDDLTDPQLVIVAAEISAECDRLGLIGEVATRAFAAAATIYGVYSHKDPLFEPIYYAPLPLAGARLLRSPTGIWASLAQVLETEFAERSGIKLILDLDSAFSKDVHLKFMPKELMERFLPERNARLGPGQLEAHLTLSEAEADRLNLTDTAARRYHHAAALLLGAHFAADPIYPWAQVALDHPGDDATRISRLRTAFKVIVRRAKTITKKDT